MSQKSQSQKSWPKMYSMSSAYLPNALVLCKTKANSKE